MNYQSLIASIQAAIYNNGAELITGNVLQAVLLDMVNALDSAGATFGGTITPASAAPADLDQPTVYLAIEAGTYTNYLDSGGNPIVTTGPALIMYEGGNTLYFSKTDLPSGGSGATVITNDGSEGDSVAIRLTDNQFYKRSFRIDMTAEYTGGSNEQRIGSLIVECYDQATGDICHGYYYGDTLADILSEVAIYQDDTDPDTFYLIMTHDSSLDYVTFAITPLDGEEVDAFVTNAADDHTKVADATITPVGGGSSDVFVATYGSTTYADIVAAYNAGKVVVCSYDNVTYVLSRIDNNYAYFGGVNQTLLYFLRVRASDSAYYKTQYNAENSSNKVSTISGNETNTTKYPNTKAVADYVAKIGEYELIKTITPVAGTTEYVLADATVYEEVRVEIRRPEALSSGTATTMWITYSINGSNATANISNANLLMANCRATAWWRGALAGGEMARGASQTSQTLVANADVILPDGATPVNFYLKYASDAAWGASDTVTVYGKKRS